MKRIFIVFLLLIFTGCGYHLVGTVSAEKKVSLKGRKIAVLPFVNRVGEPEVESEFTRALTAELLNTGKIRLVKAEEADYVITGAVVGYYRETMTVNAAGDVETYRLTMTVNIEVRDASGKIVAEYKGLSDYDDYRAFKEIERTKDAERNAVRKISKSISQLFVSLVF